MGIEIITSSCVYRTPTLSQCFYTILLFILTTSLVVSDFVDEESEVQRGRVISLKSRSRRAWAKIQIRISLTPKLALFL